MNVAGVGNISVTGGSITGLSYSTIYYIYYADTQRLFGRRGCL